MLWNDLNINHPKEHHLLLSLLWELLDIPGIHAYISQTYWARNMPLLLFSKALGNSFCIGIYDTSIVSEDGKPKQIAFAQWVTDYASFGWLGDVYVIEEYRGRGLGKWLVQVAVNLEEIKE
ncbi:hypothetical protein M422DRAFT_33863, partial [Sphaerobolus stellatus SS14]